jgi:hypothetical protein
MPIEQAGQRIVRGEKKDRAFRFAGVDPDRHRARNFTLIDNQWKNVAVEYDAAEFGLDCAVPPA